MKNTIKLFVGSILGIVTLFGLFVSPTPASAQYAVPTCNSATLNGTVITNGATTTAWFDWGPSSSVQYRTTSQTFSSDSAYSQEITGLNANTTYYYRASVSNQNGTSNGQVVSFTTSSCQTTPPPAQVCQDSAATNYGGTLPCKYPAQVCQDSSATNYGGALPCKYPVQVCQDSAATNYGGALPCKYPIQTCQDTAATNYGGTLPCKYPVQVCQDSSATNYSGIAPCKYPAQVCQDSAATNYGGALPCKYPTVQYCQDTAATNYGGPVPCKYPVVQYCQDTAATNYGGPVPCKYPVVQYCQDTAATNYGGPVPCKYPTQVTQVCTDPNANNYGRTLPCTYPVQIQTCQDSTALNYHGALPCQYPVLQVCQDSTALNYRGALPCQYPILQLCQDYSATNYHGTLPCQYNNYNNAQLSVSTFSATNVNFSSATLNGSVNSNNYNNQYNNNSSTNTWFEYGTNYNLGNTTPQNYSGSYSNSFSQSITGLQQNTIYYFRAVARNSQGTVYGNILSFTTNGNNIQINGAQPTVVLSADQTNVGFNGSTILRWYTNYTSSCTATNGSAGWAGPKSIGPGSFFTGSLTGTSTYILTCTNGYGSATDSVTVNVGGQTIRTVNTPTPKTSLVLITSSVDRNQPIVPTLDNTHPHAGDEINYTVGYQNVGTGAVTNLTLQINLPPEVDYIGALPNNPQVIGNTLIFNLGTLRAGGSGSVAVRVRVKDNTPAGTTLNFPATLSYIDPSGQPQSVSANVTAQVAGDTNNLGASVFGAGFFPGGIFGWLLIIILILLLILLVRYLLDRPRQQVAYTPTALPRRTTTTVIEH